MANTDPCDPRPSDSEYRSTRRMADGPTLTLTPFHVAGIAFLFVGFALALYQGLQAFELIPQVSWITWTHIHFVTIGAFTQLLFGTLPQLTARKLETLHEGFVESADSQPPPPNLRHLREEGIPTISDDEFETELDELDTRRRILYGLVESDAREWPSRETD